VTTQIGPRRVESVPDFRPAAAGPAEIVVGEHSPFGADVRLGRNVTIPHPEWVNLYGCTIGDNCKIGSFVEIQRGVVLGKNVKVQPFASIPSGVVIEDGAFIGPHVCFTNDLYPSSVGEDGELLSGADWEIVPTVVKRGASIGANATIVCGVTIGEGALIGAGSVVTRDVPAHSLVRGNPARVAGARPRR
jgi:acetyltransferase-like isoleucine patch superfamily enzyme